MTPERRDKIDRKKLEAADRALALADAELAKTKGDPVWGPIIGDLRNAVKVLRRRLAEEEGGDPQ